MKVRTVAAVQTENAVGNIAGNAQNMLGWARRARKAGADLAFFPECSLTGYSAARAGEVALSADSEEVAAFERFASETGMALGFGFAERNVTGGLPFITYVVTSAEGQLVYRKTHLGESERHAFSQGSSLPVADIAGMRVGVQLCWECHLPDITSTLRAQGAELVLAPHAGGIGGQRRLDAWSRYLPARALDNGLFVVACTTVPCVATSDSAIGDMIAREPGGAIGMDGGLTTCESSCAPGQASGGLAAWGPDGLLVKSHYGSGESMMLVQVGGTLPREAPAEGMRLISYYDRRRPELYR